MDQACTRRRWRLAWVVGALAGGLLAPALAQEPPRPGSAASAPGAAPALQPPPVAAFFRPATLQAARLSPSGRWIAARVARPGERTVLVVRDVEDKVPAQVVAKFSSHDVGRVRWVNDEMLVFTLSDDEDRSREADLKGQGLFAVQRDGERQRLLIKREWTTDYATSGPGPLENNHRMLALGPPGTDQVIVGEFVYDNVGLDRVRPFLLDVRTGARTTLVDNPPPNAIDWWFDHLGRARAAASRKDGQTALHWFEPETGRWRELSRFRSLNSPYWPEFVDGAGALYVSTSQIGAQTEAYSLYRLDLATGRPSDKALVSTPGFDDSIEPILDRNSGDLLGVDLLTDGRSQAWLVPAMSDIQAKVDKMLPGRINLLQCAPCHAPRAVLVHSYSDRHPGEYLLYLPQTGDWQRLGSVRPAIEPAQMGPKTFQRIKARDGADLPVWVTLPPGPSRGPRPAVVLVHGGPWSRGAEWDWNEDSQFLATRGYVVIEPEFRGSTGYGVAHYRAGWRQWGQAMQDDVADALRHAVAKGWVDPSRVCIAGASYGGYSTLMGLARDPGLYRCGVAWVAVSDPRLMFNGQWTDIDRESRQHSLPQVVGDPVADASMLAAHAPVELAGRIKAPLMLVYGSLDRRVPLEHGERMRDALVKAGNPPEWHVYGNEGHGWRRQENLVDFWTRVETFLARHLKP